MNSNRPSPPRPESAATIGAGAAFVAVVRHDVRAALRQPGEVALPIVFFVLVAAIFPLGSSAAPEVLVTLAPAVLWVAALLAMVLSLDRMFREDIDDGTLDQLLLSPFSPALIAAGRATAHWLLTGPALVVAAIPAALLLALPPRALPVLLAALALGAPALSLIGAIGAALTAGNRGRSLLLPLVTLPLLAPVLIFGTLATRAAIAGVGAAGPLYLLAAILVLSLTLAPFAIGAALSLGTE